MARLKVPPAADGAARLAELAAMADARQTPEWQAWHAWRGERTRHMVGTAGDVRHVLLPAGDPRHRAFLVRREAWRAEQRAWLEARGLPVEWAER
jgi:hypothetical protein